MRVIKIDLPASPRALDDTVSLSSAEIRRQLYRELAALEPDVNELVKQKAQAYFPHYTACSFARTLPRSATSCARNYGWLIRPSDGLPAF